MEPTLSWKPAGTRSEIHVDDYRQMSNQKKLTMKSKERIVERVVRDEDEQSEDVDVSTTILISTITNNLEPKITNSL